MLKLSNKGLYGIKALYELARNYGCAPVTIREISGRHGMPVPFLEQVLHRLKQTGLVKSCRGVNGGYFLARSPADITLGDAVRALEGPIALCDCYIKSGIKDSKKKKSHCVTSRIYKKLGKKVEEAFDSVTLHELAEEKIETTYIGTC
jgi:Rrf2 family protein